MPASLAEFFVTAFPVLPLLLRAKGMAELMLQERNRQSDFCPGSAPHLLFDFVEMAQVSGLSFLVWKMRKMAKMTMDIYRGGLAEF